MDRGRGFQVMVTVGVATVVGTERLLL